MCGRNSYITRVAAYCRVSTDKTDQINSLENQKRYFYEYVNKNPDWKLARIYADEGVTGTSTKKRKEFNRMIDDATAGMFDIIITKEISRFARNTLDSIFYTRKLKESGVGVIFMNDGINTLDADAELRLTIMSSIAQEESRKTSDRVKWGQKRRMEQGVVFGRSMLGYDVRNGEIFVNEAGAETVRLIFHKFLDEGKGTHVIARELREEGTVTASYMKSWSNTAILRILRNEKYCGDLVQKKTYTPDYLNHEKKPNRGEENYIVIRNHHEAIISRDIFERTAAELNARSDAVKSERKYSSKHCFSGKLKCGICGKGFVPLTKKRHDSSIYSAWRCSENAKNGGKHTDKAGNEVGCGNISVNAETLKEILMKAVSITGAGAADLLHRILKGAVDSESRVPAFATDTQDKIAAIQNKKKRLAELYAEEAISMDEFRELRAKYDEQIKRLNTPCADTAQNNACNLNEMLTYADKLLSGELWDDTFYRCVLESAVIYKNRIQITLLGYGLPVDVYFK